MRRQSISFICGLLLLSPVSYAQLPPCTPEHALDHQNRTGMKHRPPANKTPISQTVSGFINLKVPTITTLAERDQETPLAPEEGQVFQLTGDLWHVKLAADDCDFHLELSEPGGKKADPRIIVEIPQGPDFDNARKVLVRALRKKGISSWKPDETHDLATPLRVKVVGFGFLDAWHYTSKDPKRGHAHGTGKVATLWEIHPVWEIVPNPAH